MRSMGGGSMGGSMGGGGIVRFYGGYKKGYEKKGMKKRVCKVKGA